MRTCSPREPVWSYMVMCELLSLFSPTENFIEWSEPESSDMFALLNIPFKAWDF